MNRIGSILVLVPGVALVVTAFGHALAGWPPLHESLLRIGTALEVVRALWAGWHFGSAAMLGFGMIAIVAVVRTYRGHVPERAPLFVVAVVCIGFGVVASLLVGLSSQFPGFVVLGLLLGLGTLLLK